MFEADRCEFDLEAKLWNIPRERAKNGVAHLVPLSDEALTIIESLNARDDSDKLFPARGSGENGPSGFSKTITRVRAAIGERKPSGRYSRWTPARSAANAGDRIAAAWRAT